jgi:hypothetical protein
MDTKRDKSKAGENLKTQNPRDKISDFERIFTMLGGRFVDTETLTEKQK